jgi:hypothetical protein
MRAAQCAYRWPEGNDSSPCLIRNCGLRIADCELMALVAREGRGGYMLSQTLIWSFERNLAKTAILLTTKRRLG